MFLAPHQNMSLKRELSSASLEHNDTAPSKRRRRDEERLLTFQCNEADDILEGGELPLLPLPSPKKDTHNRRLSHDNVAKSCGQDLESKINDLVTQFVRKLREKKPEEDTKEQLSDLSFSSDEDNDNACLPIFQSRRRVIVRNGNLTVALDRRKGDNFDHFTLWRYDVVKALVKRDKRLERKRTAAKVKLLTLRIFTQLVSRSRNTFGQITPETPLVSQPSTSRKEKAEVMKIKNQLKKDSAGAEVLGDGIRTGQPEKLTAAIPAATSGADVDSSVKRTAVVEISNQKEEKVIRPLPRNSESRGAQVLGGIRTEQPRSFTPAIPSPTSGADVDSSIETTAVIKISNQKEEEKMIRPLDHLHTVQAIVPIKPLSCDEILAQAGKIASSIPVITLDDDDDDDATKVHEITKQADNTQVTVPKKFPSRDQNLVQAGNFTHVIPIGAETAENDENSEKNQGEVFTLLDTGHTAKCVAPDKERSCDEIVEKKRRNDAIPVGTNAEVQDSVRENQNKGDRDEKQTAVTSLLYEARLVSVIENNCEVILTQKDTQDNPIVGTSPVVSESLVRKSQNGAMKLGTHIDLEVIFASEKEKSCEIIQAPQDMQHSAIPDVANDVINKNTVRQCHDKEMSLGKQTETTSLLDKATLESEEEKNGGEIIQVPLDVQHPAIPVVANDLIYKTSINLCHDVEIKHGKPTEATSLPGEATFQSDGVDNNSCEIILVNHETDSRHTAVSFPGVPNKFSVQKSQVGLIKHDKKTTVSLALHEDRNTQVPFEEMDFEMMLKELEILSQDSPIIQDSPETTSSAVIENHDSKIGNEKGTELVSLLDECSFIKRPEDDNFCGAQPERPSNLVTCANAEATPASCEIKIVKPGDSNDKKSEASKLTKLRPVVVLERLSEDFISQATRRTSKNSFLSSSKTIRNCSVLLTRLSRKEIASFKMPATKSLSEAICHVNYCSNEAKKSKKANSDVASNDNTDLLAILSQETEDSKNPAVCSDKKTTEKSSIRNQSSPPLVAVKSSISKTPGPSLPTIAPKKSSVMLTTSSNTSKNNATSTVRKSCVTHIPVQQKENVAVSHSISAKKSEEPKQPTESAVVPGDYSTCLAMKAGGAEKVSLKIVNTHVTQPSNFKPGDSSVAAKPKVPAKTNKAPATKVATKPSRGDVGAIKPVLSSSVAPSGVVAKKFRFDSPPTTLVANLVPTFLPPLSLKQPFMIPRKTSSGNVKDLRKQPHSAVKERVLSPNIAAASPVVTQEFNSSSEAAPTSRFTPLTTKVQMRPPANDVVLHPTVTPAPATTTQGFNSSSISRSTPPTTQVQMRLPTSDASSNNTRLVSNRNIPGDLVVVSDSNNNSSNLKSSDANCSSFFGDRVIRSKENHEDASSSKNGQWGAPRPGYDFVSTDYSENVDNFNPGWDALRNVANDEERYRRIRSRWRNLGIPDPAKNLTFRHKRPLQPLPQEPRQQPLPARRRQRSLSCTSLYELMVEKAKFEAQKDMNILMAQQKREITKMSQLQQQTLLTLSRVSTHFYRDPQLVYNLLRQQQKEMIDMMSQHNDQQMRIQRSRNEEIQQYQKYMQEVRTFYSFYQGLDIEDKSDKTILTPEQVEIVQEIERMYDSFTRIYRS